MRFKPQYQLTHTLLILKEETLCTPTKINSLIDYGIQEMLLYMKLFVY